MEDNSLLEQIRQVKHTLLQAGEPDHLLEEGTKKIAEITGSAGFILDKKGNVLASHQGNVNLDSHLDRLVQKVSISFDSGLPAILKTDEPLINEQYSPAIFDHKVEQNIASENNILYTAIPIKAGTESMAVLLLYHPGHLLKEEQLILAEVGTALISMILLQQFVGREEEDTRNKALAEGAFESLSYSEVEAIREILKNINNNESIVVASKIADGLGITRSVIVNALRKFESAGIIESRSLGMKGTLIRIKNSHAMEIIASRSENMSSII